MKEISSENNSIEVIKSLASGSIAGICSCLVFHPMDVIRTKLQSNLSIKHSQKSILSIMKQSIKEKSLYTGLSTPLAAQAIYKATIFTVFKTSDSIFFSNRQSNFLTTFICGSVAGVVNGGMFVTPIEFIRNKMILLKPTNPTIKPIQLVRSTLLKEGTRGLYRGLLITMLRDGLGCGAFFSTNYLALSKFAEPKFEHQVLAGAMAGISYWAVSLPLDAIKTNIQTGRMGSISESFSKLGFNQLFTGYQVAFGRGAPSAALTICVYDYAFNTLNLD